MMRFVADENIPGDVVAALGNAGHDVLWIRAASPGASDERVLEIVSEQRRILLTFDKDFGEIAWRSRLPHECTVQASNAAVLRSRSGDIGNSG